MVVILVRLALVPAGSALAGPRGQAKPLPIGNISIAPQHAICFVLWNPRCLRPNTCRGPSARIAFRTASGKAAWGWCIVARDREGRPVAVKVLHPLGTDGVNARRRLAREVETMRRVRSPYVAEVLDADVTGEYPVHRHAVRGRAYAG